MRVISISGADGAGKSTLARKIERELIGWYEAPVLVRVCPIAETLRQEMANTGKYTLNELWYKPTPEHIRNELIAWGYEKRKREGEDYFIRACLEHAQHTLDLNTAILDDLRFPNELKYIRDRYPDSQHIHIQNPEAEDSHDRPYYEHLPWLYCQADTIITR